MNFCQKHWDELKDAVIERGLEQYIASDGPQGAAHIVRQFKGDNTLLDFEPLLGSSINLHALATHVAGLPAVMTADPDTGRPPCPVCLLMSFDWIAASADGALEEAKSRGLT